MTRKRLRKNLIRILFVLLCLIRVGTVSGESGEKLTVGVPVDRCPVFYLDDQGIVVGIGADLMILAAGNAGYTVTFRPITEKTLKDALDNPVYDIVMPFGSAIASTAGQPTEVSDNLIRTPFTLVTEGNRDLPPLNRLRVGMLRSQGGVAETVRTLYPGMEINMYETMPECVKALRNGNVDALLHNSYVWSYVLQKPSYSDLVVQPSAMFSMDFRAGTTDTPEGNAIIERLNRGIAEVSETQRQAITLDYTSRRLYRYSLSDYIYMYGWVILCAFLVLSLAVMLLIRRQRRNRQAQEEKVRRLIDEDPLTGVLSMEGFRKRVEELLKENPDIPYMISYNNIKNFKYINDSLGRAAGDDLLRFWVARSKDMLGEEEAMGRTAADRFVVLHHMKGDEKIRRDITDVLEPVRDYFIQQGKENRVQLCCGVYVLTPEDYRNIDVDRMLDCARIAERRVRDSHRDGYEFYNPDQWKIGQQTGAICDHLSVALRNGEVQVWYQPQTDYAAGKVIGAEALCRWHHVSLGWISPGVFIPLLEKAGLIYELDSFVWEQVCRDLQKWNRKGLRFSASVNLSRSDIREGRDIVGQFRDLVKTYELSAGQLRIEVTETAFTQDAGLLLQTVVKLREAGFQVEMDDFGSGYSSLHMLKEVPVDRIKLDLNFLSGAGDPEKGRIIVCHIIRMIRSLGMKIIAEGVENESQAEFLRDQGCAEMQGFWFYKPMPVQELEKIIESPDMEDDD